MHPSVEEYINGESGGNVECGNISMGKGEGMWNGGIYQWVKWRGCGMGEYINGERGSNVEYIYWGE